MATNGTPMATNGDDLHNDEMWGSERSRLSSKELYEEKTKDETIQAMTTKQVAGGLIPFILGLVALSMAAASLATPILLIPVNDPDDGLMKNLPYWIGYNPGVTVLYQISSYLRLAKICSRAEPELKVDYGLNGKSFAFLIYAYVLVSTISIAIGFFVGDSAATSYNMAYLCPICCISLDVSFIFMLPPAERTIRNAKFLFNYSGMIGPPIFIMFIPVAMKVFLPPLFATLIPVLVFPALGLLLQTGAEKIFTKEIETVGFECSWIESGIPIHMETMIAIGEMMLFPGATGVLVLCAIITVEAVQRTYNLVKYYYLLAAVKEQTLRVSYVQIGVPTDGAETASKLAWFNADNSQKEYARGHINELSPEGFAETYHKGVVHLTTLTCPVIFTFFTMIITHYHNKPYYYVYECLDEDDVWVSAKYALIALCFQMLFFTIDIVILSWNGMASTFVILFQAFLKNNLWMIMFTVSFVCGVFTSCFMIKHDGLELLKDLVINCKEAGSSADFSLRSS